MINFTPARTHIPKHCYDNIEKKWVLCDEIVLRNRNFKGKSTDCCIDSSRCCFTCDDLAELSTALYNINVASSQPYFYEAGIPSLPVPDASILIFIFNLVNTKWQIEEGVGIRNVEKGILYDCYKTFTYVTEFSSSPSKYCFIMQSDITSCFDLKFCTYIYEEQIVGAENWWISRRLKPNICLNDFEDIYYDDVDDRIHCEYCSSLITRQCYFDRDVTQNLPGTIYWNNSYTFIFDLFVDECCDSDFVTIYITPNVYISIPVNPLILPISQGVNSISVTLDVTSSFSGEYNFSASLYIIAGCANISIPLKAFIDDIPV